MNKKICFAGLVSDLNLGDQIIFKSTEVIYKKELINTSDYSTIKLDLTYGYENIVEKFFFKILNKLFFLFGINDNVFLIKKEISFFKEKYKKHIAGCDLIVIVGGGVIKYKYQKFYVVISALIKAAEELGIPVVINAVGVEDFDKNDNRCKMLKYHLNMDIVKSITTRDDFFTLNHLYLEGASGKYVDKVADSAVYCDEVFEISKKESTTYGIGLIRGEIFLDNHKKISKNELARFYADLIFEMEKRNLKYQLFTNGFPGDVDLLSDIKSFLSREKLNVLEPTRDCELVETISSFRAIIAARLHANIIAYALNIPSVGIVWNEKLLMFGTDIGYPERYFSCDELNAKNLVDALLKADAEGYDLSNREKYRCSAKNSIRNIVDKLFNW